MPNRAGFIIPNASDVAPDYQASQPDKGDFIVLGNSRYGVVVGCQVALSSYTASVGTTGSSDPHILAVNGVIYSLDGGATVHLSSQGTSARFDLIAFDTSLGLTVVAGTPSSNPVFPDITDTMVVLAAVFIPASGGTGTPKLIDKRTFLQPSMIGVNVDTLITSYVNSNTGTFTRLQVTGAGKISWGGGTGEVDTVLERTATATLKVSDTLQAKNLRATETLRLNNYDVVTSERIGWGTSRPVTPSSGTGTVYVNTSNGNIDVYKGGSWTTIGTTIPAGTVIMSFNSPESMSGWLSLEGQLVTQTNAGSLWDMFPGWRSGGLFQLPDMRGRLPIGAGFIDTNNPGTPNTEFGDLTDGKGTIKTKIKLENMPRHAHQRRSDDHDDFDHDDDDDDDEYESHSSRSNTGYEGYHNHQGSTQVGGSHAHTISSSGNHAHPVQDLQHVHNFGSDKVVVASVAGADTCLDIIFNDASHSHTTKPRDNTGAAKSNVYVDFAGAHTHGESEHSGHTHVFNIAQSGTHRHAVPQHYWQGGGKDVQFRPPSLSMYFYIKT